MSTRRWLLAGSVALLLAGGQVGARSGELLWSAETADACRILLVHQHGDVEVHRGRGDAQLRGEAARWRVEQHREDGVLSLRTVPVAAAAAGDPAPLRLDVARDCALEIRTGAGDVQVHGRHQAPLTVESATGQVVLWVEERDDLSVELATSGVMGVDYSIDIEHLHHQEPDKRGLVSIGDGGVPVRLASKRGAVRVLQRGRASGH